MELFMAGWSTGKCDYCADDTVIAPGQRDIECRECEVVRERREEVYRQIISGGNWMNMGSPGIKKKTPFAKEFGGVVAKDDWFYGWYNRGSKSDPTDAIDHREYVKKEPPELTYAEHAQAKKELWEIELEKHDGGPS